MRVEPAGGRPCRRDQESGSPSRRRDSVISVLHTTSREDWLNGWVTASQGASEASRGRPSGGAEAANDFHRFQPKISRVDPTLNRRGCPGHFDKLLLRMTLNSTGLPIQHAGCLPTEVRWQREGTSSEGAESASSTGACRCCPRYPNRLSSGRPPVRHEQQSALGQQD
jgi:hypothetical protein